MRLLADWSTASVDACRLADTLATASAYSPPTQLLASAALPGVGRASALTGGEVPGPLRGGNY
jgi:hypothetical protein